MMLLLGKLFAPQKVAAIVLRKKGRQWYSVQIGRNGEDMYVSEHYSSKAKCEETARGVAAQIGCPLR